MSESASRDRRCANCEYDLTGVPSTGRCPECGNEIAYKRSDSILLNLYRCTVGVCCYLLLTSVALEGMYLDGYRSIGQPHAFSLPNWWWMAACIVVPMAVAWIVGMRIRRAPTRVVICAGVLFWLTLSFVAIVERVLESSEIVWTAVLPLFAGGFLAVAGVSRWWPRG